MCWFLIYLQQGVTVLYCACANARGQAVPGAWTARSGTDRAPDIVAALLQHGADPNLPNIAPPPATRHHLPSTAAVPGTVPGALPLDSPLWKAACNGCLATVQTMLRFGADPSAAASFIRSVGMPPGGGSPQYPRNPAIVQALLDEVGHAMDHGGS